MIITNKELKAFLDRLPDPLKMTGETAEFLDREIRQGRDLNHMQRQNVFDLMRWCSENKAIPPSPLESLSAYAYHEWTELAKTEESCKPHLAGLVKLLKSDAAAAPKVVQTVQAMLKERDNRRKEQAKAIEAMAAVSDAVHDGPKNEKKVVEAANIWIKRMQAARMGFGANAMQNLDLACTIADQAVEAHPNNPKVIFEAAGCHHLQATKGKGLQVLDRYVHMRQADTLYQKTLSILTAVPYSKLKGEYDKWRSGLGQILIKVQEELKGLEERTK